MPNPLSRVITDFAARFAAYQADAASAPIHADLRSPVYRAAIRSNAASAVAALKKEWYSTPAIDGKEICLAAIGHATEKEVISSVVLPFLFNASPPAPASESVPGGDMHILATAMAANRQARPLLWAHMRDNWAELTSKLGGNPILLDRMINVSLGKFSDRATLEDIEAFFSQRSTKGFDRTLETVKDKIRGRAAYRERDAEALRKWLGANGYA